MLILMGLESPREHIEIVMNKVSQCGCTAHEIPGASRLAIGITGPCSSLNKDEFLVLPSVQDVVRVTKKFKLVSRIMKEENTVVNFGNSTVGSDELLIIAGPCAVENRDQIFRVAEELANIGIKFFRGGAYKPRTSPYSFQGLKEKGLKLLDDVKNEFGMKIVTETIDPFSLEAVSEVADILQIGARNMQNFTLLEAAAKKNIPVLLKRGMSAQIEELLLSAEYVLSGGNNNVILCERGIRTFESSTRNTLDLNAVPVVKKNSHLPIIVDPSHGIGIGDGVPAMALAGVAAGADGLIIEVHSEPEKALSDGYQSLTPKTFKHLIEKLKQLAPIVNKKVVLNEA